MVELSFENISDRLPPQNIDAEESILGGILLDPAASKIFEILEIDSFSIQSHQTIYQACLSLYKVGKPTDLMSVATWLLDRKLLDKAGGQSKLAQLVDRTVSAVNIEQYAELVRDKHTRRKIISAGHEIIKIGYETSTELPQCLEEVEGVIFEIMQGRSKSSCSPVSDALATSFQEIEDLHLGNKLPGLNCSFYDLDAITGGFQRSDLVIIAARPSMGKTSFGVNIGLDIARIHNLPVVIFSLEMSKEQLAQRLLAAESGIESNRLRTGRIGFNEWEFLTRGLGILSELPIFIDDSSNISVSGMRSTLRRIQAENRGELGMVIVDYLQLMESDNQENRDQELSKITRGLKGLAKEFNVPVLALSQLSRNVEPEIQSTEFRHD